MKPTNPIPWLASLLSLTGALGAPTTASNRRCLSLPMILSGSIDVTTTYFPAGELIPVVIVPGCEFGPASVYRAIENVCRVTATIPTSHRSEVKVEAWLPDTNVWQGRFLAVGNGGLGGCFFYDDLLHGSGIYHMATINTNNGHDGNTAEPMLNNEDVLEDFVWRALEVEHDVGLEITEAYYQRKPSKKYYQGCSTGGRQGMYLAQYLPELYDGVIAGAPAIDQQHLGDQFGRLGVINGFKSNLADTNLVVGIDDLPVITAEVLKQCDTLDGVKDGIIDEPDKCNFKAEKLLCSEMQLAAGQTTGICLNKEQVNVVKEFFTPLYFPDGKLMYPRFDPGFTSSQPYMFNSFTWQLTLDVYRYLIYNDSNYNLDNFSMKDILFGDKVNPGQWATWNTDLTKLKKSGTKLLSYHGTADGIIPSGNTVRYYNLVKSHMSPGTPSLDPFWKHFVIPGMDHCLGSTLSGSAPWNFGQPMVDPRGTKMDTSHNLLLAMVAWVEQGRSPKELVGTKFVEDDPELGVEGQRRYCPYPGKSVLSKGGDPKKAGSWKCV